MLFGGFADRQRTDMRRSKCQSMPLHEVFARDEALCERSNHRHLEHADRANFHPRFTELVDYPLSKPQIQFSSNAADLLDVILAGVFVWSFEKASGVFAEPLGQLVEFFAEAVDGLLVHVCLGDEFG